MKGINKLKILLNNTDEVLKILIDISCPCYFNLTDNENYCDNENSDCKKCWQEALDKEYESPNINRRVIQW